MLFSSIVVAAVAFIAASVSAQTTSANSTIDPSSVPLTTRNQWCQSQMNVCGTLCSGSTLLPDGNTCNGTTLDFNCTCSANNSAPALVLYTGTMPTFICEQIFNNCNLANVGVAAAQAKCKSDEEANCGHFDPANFVAAVPSSSSSAASTTGTGTAGGSSATGTASSSTSAAAAATMMAMAGQYGSGLLAVGAAAAFGMML